MENLEKPELTPEEKENKKAIVKKIIFITIMIDILIAYFVFYFFVYNKKEAPVETGCLLQEYFRQKPQWAEKADYLINKIKNAMQELEK